VAQTVVIADLTFRQDLLAKTLSMSAQMDIIGATNYFFAVDVLNSAYDFSLYSKLPLAKLCRAHKT
jgi:hypothetical protein